MSKTPSTWDQAHAFCSNEAGTLVSITNGFEQAYVSLVKTGSVNPEWIGLRSVNIYLISLILIWYRKKLNFRIQQVHSNG